MALFGSICVLWQFNFRFCSNLDTGIYLYSRFHSLPTPVIFCWVSFIYPHKFWSVHIFSSRNQLWLTNSYSSQNYNILTISAQNVAYLFVWVSFDGSNDLEFFDSNLAVNSMFGSEHQKLVSNNAEKSQKIYVTGFWSAVWLGVSLLRLLGDSLKVHVMLHKIAGLG